MRLTLLVVLIALLMAAPAPFALADGHERGGRPDDAGPPEGRGPSENTNAPEGRGPPEGQGPPEGRGPSDLSIGAFQLRAAQREVTGDHVSFTYTERGLADYRVGGTPIFNMSVEEKDQQGRLRGAVAHGAQIRVEMPDFTLRAHDNPTGASRLDTDGNATFSFPPGALITRQAGERAQFVLGNLSGMLRASGLDVSGEEVRTSGPVVIVLDTPRGAFDVHRQKINEAIGMSVVGAESSFVQTESGLREDTVSFTDVNVTTLRAEAGNLTMLIEGHGQAGRVIVFNVDARILGAKSADELDIRFNNRTMQMADDLADALDPDNDGLEPEYYVVWDPQTETFQMIVSIPHYSVHVLSIGTFVTPVTPSVIAGVLVGLMLLAPGGYVLFRPRR